MRNACPAAAVKCLQQVEKMMPSVVLTLTKASMALRMGDLMMYEREMDSYKEVKSAESTSCSRFAKPKAGGLACSCILR